MNLLGRKGDNGNLPVAPTLQTTQPQPVRRKFSDAAALAAQHVIDLENMCESLQHELSEAKAEASAFKRMIDEYRQDITALTNERDWHKQRHTDMDTTLQNAAAMIVNCYDRGRPKANTDVDKTVQAGLEKELGTPAQSTEPVAQP